MLALLGLHLAVGAVLVASPRALVGRRTLPYAVAAVPSAATCAWLVARWRAIGDGDVLTERLEWIPRLGVELSLRLDGFAALMLVLVGGIGVLVFAYSASYTGTPQRSDVRSLGLLVLFAGAMTGLVLADDLLAVYGFWELTSIASFLLIGRDHERPQARAAALQALLVTGAGALAMLTGFILLGQAAGTYRLSELAADPPGGALVDVALVLVLVGAFTKSAQVPFHAWLPAAMVAPTPVSTYLHSATMVKAGVYLVARLAPIFAAGVALWRPLVVSVGIVTMVVGGLRALRRTDLKLLLADGTVSQLGLMIAVFGWGTPSAEVAGSVMLLAHGAFKATAFMVVGIVDHQRGTRDVRALPRPDRSWSAVVAVALVAAASMAGVPLMLGFVAKEADFETFVDQGAGALVALVAIVAGSALTTAYSLRFAAGVTGRLAPTGADTAPGPAPALWFTLPAAILAVATVATGVVPQVLDGVVGAAARALGRAGDEVHLELWHGLALELALSAAALAAGTVLYLARRPVDGVLAAGGALVPSSAAAYRATLRGVEVGADRVTAVAQPGSLPLYLGVILSTAALVPGLLLLRGSWWPGWPDVVDLPAQVPIAALLVSLALAATIARRRFAGALLLGMVGYTMAGLFVLQGAPDLALTQVAIETLTTVLFVLVLRRLPDRFAPRPDKRRAARVVIAAAVGTTVLLLTLAVGSLDPSTDVSDAMIERSLPEGDGRNVVNVILVDIRGLDTLGELTVLAAAAIGTVALARAGRRPGGASARRREPGELVPPPVRTARLVTIEVSTRLVSAAVLLGSLWLLFAGHNQPGGGFVGGIVAGAAVSLRYIAGGIDDVRRLSRGRPWIVLGAGLAIAASMAVLPLVVGDAVLQQEALSVELPVLGTLKVTTALVFDIGVYLVVVGLALMVFESFGDDSRARRPDPAVVDG